MIQEERNKWRYTRGGGNGRERIDKVCGRREKSKWRGWKRQLQRKKKEKKRKKKERMSNIDHKEPESNLEEWEK